MTDPVVEHASPLPFAQTIARLTAAIASHGLTVFAVIDHAANAQGVSLSTDSLNLRRRQISRGPR